MKNYLPTQSFLNKFSSPGLKKTLFVIGLSTASCSAWSQGFEYGVRGAFDGAFFMNSNIFKPGSEQGYRFVPSFNGGLHAGIIFNKGNGLELDILFGTLSQGYGGNFTGSGEFPSNGISYYKGESYTAKTTLNTLEVPLLYRHEDRITGAYVEFGPGYDVISGANYSATYTNPSQTIRENVSNQYPKGNFMAIAGFGWDKKFSRTSNFYFMTGFRFTYGMMDLQGVDGHGQELKGAQSVILYDNIVPHTYYNTYHTTHSIDASFNMGLYYRITPRTAMHRRRMDF